ncbi:MAG: flagellar assembly protein FliW [Candidatus Omnitrophica bacterium]|nr:flagellar assembly protein FliW [Candidatus Omnitrophota bacterium]
MKTSIADVDRTTSHKKMEVFFPEGVIGFSGHRTYSIREDKSKEPFLWMQSNEDEQLSFILIDPREFKQDYKPVLSEVDKIALGVNNVEECKCLAIVAVPEDASKISANLLAPIMINEKESIARQVVLQDQEYLVQCLILDEMNKNLERKDASSFTQTK